MSQRKLPGRLERLKDKLPDRTARRVDALFESQAERISTGRVGRAMKLSKLAIGGGRQLVSQRARRMMQSGNFDALVGDVELATELVETMSNMRGLAMKAGQMLSYLDGVMPPEAQKVLTLLQNDAPPMEPSVVREIVEEELGAPVETLFQEFSDAPIAAASIGQVHKARLPDGTVVAVKVQYPGIDLAMASDMKNARFMSMFKGMLFFRTDTKAIMDELETRFLEECDYNREAQYQARFRQRFEGHHTIVIPEVHEDLCSRRVLTTTFCDGVSFYEWLDSNPAPEARARVARTIYRFYLGSLYMDGLFNCDPHPGNYLFLADGRIAFLDHGCTRDFDPGRRRAWVELCRAVCRDDPEEIHDRSVDIGFVAPGVSYDKDALRKLLRYLYQAHLEDVEFDFSRMAPGETFREMFLHNPNLFKMNMPADAVFLNRITFGLVSLLTEIGATMNCHRHVLAYFEGRDPDWPNDPLLVQ